MSQKLNIPLPTAVYESEELARLMQMAARFGPAGVKALKTVAETLAQADMGKTADPNDDPDSDA